MTPTLTLLDQSKLTESILYRNFRRGERLTGSNFDNNPSIRRGATSSARQYQVHVEQVRSRIVEFLRYRNQVRCRSIENNLYRVSSTLLFVPPTRRRLANYEIDPIPIPYCCYKPESSQDTMNPRLKRIAHLPSVECGEDSSLHVSARFSPSREVSPTFPNTSTVQDEAALLLSIAGICDREVKNTGFAAIFDEFPRFPALSGPRSSPQELSALKPRSEPVFALQEEPLKPCFQTIRSRSVSIDYPGLEVMDIDRTTSPLSLPDAQMNSFLTAAVLVSPITPHATAGPLPLRKQSLRRAKQARREPEIEEHEEEHLAPAVSSKDKKGKTLQPSPPKGVPIKTIGRKKFSWKCYPEVCHTQLSLALVSISRIQRTTYLHTFSPRFDSWNNSWLRIAKSIYDTRLSIIQSSRSNTTTALRMICSIWPLNMDTFLIRKNSPSSLFAIEFVATTSPMFNPPRSVACSWVMLHARPVSLTKTTLSAARTLYKYAYQ
jgi:hypothetical protein